MLANFCTSTIIRHLGSNLSLLFCSVGPDKLELLLLGPKLSLRPLVLQLVVIAILFEAWITPESGSRFHGRIIVLEGCIDSKELAIDGSIVSNPARTGRILLWDGTSPVSRRSFFWAEIYASHVVKRISPCSV